VQGERAQAATPPCGGLSAGYDPARPPRYEHVVVLMEENVSYGQFQASSQMPYLRRLSRLCGSATNFHAATHPSMPNYMAATSGIASPQGRRVDHDNIFKQLERRGRTWKSYQESMPGPCSSAYTGFYKTGHNPAFFYDNLRTPVNTCKRNDVPMRPALDSAIANDALPSYSWITPNQCHIFYWVSNCSTPRANAWREGDRWLSGFLPRLLAMPSYRAGKTLIIITFDEGLEDSSTHGVDCTNPSYYRDHPDCHIPTVVVSPYIVPGKADGRDLNLYSLLGTTQDILGLPRLAKARGEPSMRTGLRF
jgi:phospholipase C